MAGSKEGDEVWGKISPVMDEVCVCGKSFPVPHAASREVQGKEMKRARGPLRSL